MSIFDNIPRSFFVKSQTAFSFAQHANMFYTQHVAEIGILVAFQWKIKYNFSPLELRAEIPEAHFQQIGQQGAPARRRHAFAPSSPRYPPASGPENSACCPVFRAQTNKNPQRSGDPEGLL